MKTVTIWIVVGLMSGLWGQDLDGVQERRAQAQRLSEEGNWKEALDLRKALLGEVSDKDSAGDLTEAVKSLRKGNVLKDFDSILETVVARHAGNWSVLAKAGQLYIDVQHYGFLLDGEFQRGHHRGGGDWVVSLERDRVRAIQLSLLALKVGEDTLEVNERVQLMSGLGRALLLGRNSSKTVWALGVLTDLETLPDQEQGNRISSGNGAPVAGDGEPLWMPVPSSWEKAVNDGERWRWTLSQARAKDPNAIDFEWARFLERHYSVTTLASYGWWKNQDEEGEKGILQVHTLKETESLARLAGGVQRFELPEDYQFIPLLRRISRGDGGISAAGDRLVQILLNRRQYAEAAVELRTVIKQHGHNEKRRTKLLAQIVGDWGRFEPSGTFAAGEEVSVGYVYRNAKKVSLSLHRIKLDELTTDIFEYLESDPKEIDRGRIQPQAVGQRLIDGDAAKYRGALISKWEKELNPHKKHWDTRSELAVPVEKAGAYLLEAKSGDGNTSWTLVWVTDAALVRNEMKEGLVYFLGEIRAGAPLEGELEFFGYRTERRKEQVKGQRRYDVLTKRFRKKVGADGLVTVTSKDMPSRYQWMVVAKGSAGQRVLMGFSHHHWRDQRDETWRSERSLFISDRPVYRPGQTVKMTFWSREARYDLDDDESKFGGKACRVRIRNPLGEEVAEIKNLRTDQHGAVEFEFELPEEARLGRYQVILDGEVPSGHGGIRVEEYKKPEFEVLVEGPKEPVRLGEVIKAKIKAVYYHGAPVTEATVKVKVERKSYSERWFPRGRWDWLYGEGYWWTGTRSSWHPGWSVWGCVAPSPPWWGGPRWTPAELVFEKEYAIGADGSVEVEIDTALAKMVHGDLDHEYTITAEVVDASRRVIVGTGSVLAARKAFEVTAWLDRGYARPGDALTAHYAARTLDGKPVVTTGKTTLYRLRLAGEELKEELVRSWDLAEESDGEGEFVFEAPEAGQYRLATVLTDAKGNESEGGLIFSVRGEKDTGLGSRFGDLELILEKKEYQPGETARLLINTNEPGSTVLLFLRPNNGQMEELRVLRMEGKSQEVALDLALRDMPNIFVEAVTIARGKVVKVVREIVLPPESRMLTVEVSLDKEKYKPQEKGKVRIKLTDDQGAPFQGTTVLTVYDKSLEYISGGSNVPELKKFFWEWKRSYYSRLAHSQQWRGLNLSKRTVATMRTLGRFSRVQIRTTTRKGFSGGRGGELLAMENSVDSFSAHGELDAAPAAPMMARENSLGLGEESKGGESGENPPVLIRSEFADLIKWVGSVETDENGEAVIDLELPDNLTTWKVRTWAMGAGTRVGQGEAEFITSKDLLVRLQAPRFFVVGDEVVLSAVVHNYHDEAKEVAVSLELDGGTLSTQETAPHEIVIPSGGEKRINWVATAIQEGEVTIRMKALAADDGDAMEQKFPVYVHGMPRTESWSRVIAPDGDSTEILFTVPEARRPGESRLEIRYSPTIAGAMVDALPYLVSYPHGCTEQTLNRFVPTVVTQKLLREMGVDLTAVKNKRVNLNPQEIGGSKERAAQWKHWKENPVWDEKEVDAMVAEGVKRLGEMQLRDGGWGWFSAYGQDSYPHTTAVVVDGLLTAKESGAKIPEKMLKRGLAWLERYEKREADRIRMWEKRKRNTKKRADAMDAYVRRVLGRSGIAHEEMLGFLVRDKNELAVYAKCLVALELHRTKQNDTRDAVVRNIEQFLKTDDENQTAWLELGNGNYWWRWYGSEFEAHAAYLQLLSKIKPKSAEARGLAKYLLNNRKHANYWRSTRDTAYCIEALADYLRASEEGKPEMEVEVVVDGKILKTVSITAENLFTFDGTVVVAGDAVTSGAHRIELRKKGKGPLYANAYLTVFTLEDFIEKAGLEVKVDRTLYRLVPVVAEQAVAGSQGQALTQRKEKYERVEIKSGDSVQSGDLVEVELTIESKNDYSYLMFEDWKAAGMEAAEVQSGYNPNGLGAYMELRDEKVSLYVRNLPRGKHNLRYRLRAEIPGRFSALPTRAEAMYAPELKANSDEWKVRVIDQ